MTGKKIPSLAPPPGYTELEKLGEGPDSIVWSVRHNISDEKLALKMATVPDPAHRLQREYAILSRLDVPGIVKVKEFGEHEGREFFSMELIRGVSFTDYFKRLPDLTAFVDIFLKICQKSAVILSDLHKQGIVHIDIKPSNLLITEDGEPILLDFGFSEDYSLSPTAEPLGTTLDYAAPELLSGGQMTPAADIYSLGVLAYEVLTGQKPWGEKSVRELVRCKLKSPPGLGVVGDEYPSGLEELILRMLNPEPSLRPTSNEIIAEIEWFSTGKKGQATTVHPMIVPKLSFGGRDSEIAELERLLFGEKRVVLVNGKSGVGKTRLLRELRFRALLGGHNVVYIEGRGAHLSLVEHLADILDLSKEQRSAEDSGQFDSKWSRYEKVLNAVEEGDFDGVFIDVPVDATEDEALFLEYMARSLDGTLGVVFSQAPGQLYPEGKDVTLHLLDTQKVLDVVSKTFEGLRGSDKLAEILVSMGEGNPRRMNELLEILHDEGWLSWRQGWVYEPGKNERSLARKLEKWFGESIERLDTDSKLALHLLALIESALPVEVLAKKLQDRTPLVLRGLINKGLVRSFIYADKPHYEFGNDIIRPYILGNLNDEDKKVLSRQLADLLEVYSKGLWGVKFEKWNTTYLAQVGSLYFEAGIKEKATPYLVDAGRRLFKLGDSEKAKQFLSLASESSFDPEGKKSALYELAEIALNDHNPELAERLFLQVLSLSEGTPQEKAKIFLRIAYAYLGVVNMEQFRVYTERSEQYASVISDSLRGQQLYTRGWYLLMTGEAKKAEVLFRRSLKFIESLPDQRQAHFALAAVYRRIGMAAKALEHTEKLVEITRKEGNAAKACVYTASKSILCYMTGDFTGAEQSMEESLETAAKIKTPRTKAEILLYRVVFLFYAARYREALNTIRQAIHICEKINDSHRITTLRWREAQCLHFLGDWVASQKAYIQLWKELHGTQNPPVNYILKDWSILYRNRGEFRIAHRLLNKSESRDESNSVVVDIALERCKTDIASGNIPQAADHLKRLKHILEEREEALIDREFSLLEADILLSDGQYSKAREKISSVISDIERFKPLAHIRADAYLTLGKTLLASGNYDEGLIRLKDSLTISKSQENPYKQGIAFYEIAQALLEKQRWSQEGQSNLDEARTIFARLGARVYLEKVKKLSLIYNEQIRYKEERMKREHPDEYLDKLEKVSEIVRDLKTGHSVNRGGSPVEPRRYLDSFKKVSELINNQLGKPNFMVELLSVVIDLTGADRGAVFMVEGEHLHPVATVKIDDVTSEDARRTSMTVIDNVRAGLEPIYTSDAAADVRFNRSQSIRLNRIRSLMCIPLKTADRLIGTIYLDSTMPGLFNAQNTLYLEALGNLLAASVEKSDEFRRLDEDLVLIRGKESFEKSGIVMGSSVVMKELYRQMSQIARTDSNVLLEGETGTGKGVFARMLHDQSQREAREFCSVNCGILPENMFESELFGTKKGAYTGADRDRTGLLEAANGSTVFFDEITNTSLAIQAKLLEVIEEKVIRRFGEVRKKQVDLRFIFATNRNLEEEVRARRFRKDLYFRMATVKLTLPPLRDRREDIPEFVEHFVKLYAREFNKDITSISPDAMQAFLDYSWPGNIRELRSSIERLVLLSKERTITVGILRQHYTPIVSSHNHRTADRSADVVSVPLDDPDLKRAKQRFEKAWLREVISRYRTLEEAAEALGIDRKSLWRKRRQMDE